MMQRLPVQEQSRVIGFGQLVINSPLKDHLVFSIELVPNDGVAKRCEMNADLVLTTCEQLTLNQGEAMGTLDDSPVCPALLPIGDASHL